jgi:hypothetical protein
VSCYPTNDKSSGLHCLRTELYFILKIRTTSLDVYRRVRTVFLRLVSGPKPEPPWIVSSWSGDPWVDREIFRVSPLKSCIKTNMTTFHWAVRMNEQSYRSRDSSVGTSTGYGLDVRGFIPRQGKRYFSTPKRPDRRRVPPNLLYSEYQRFLGVKRPEREAHHSI